MRTMDSQGRTAWNNKLRCVDGEPGREISLVVLTLKPSSLRIIKKKKKLYYKFKFDWTYYILGASQVVLVVKNPPARARDTRDVGSIPGSGRSLGGQHGNPIKCSCLEDPWQVTVHWVAKRYNWSNLARMQVLV